jgi:hypothetical protein
MEFLKFSVSANPRVEKHQEGEMKKMIISDRA